MKYYSQGSVPKMGVGNANLVYTEEGIPVHKEVLKRESTWYVRQSVQHKIPKRE